MNYGKSKFAHRECQNKVINSYIHSFIALHHNLLQFNRIYNENESALRQKVDTELSGEDGIWAKLWNGKCGEETERLENSFSIRSHSSWIRKYKHWIQTDIIVSPSASWSMPSHFRFMFFSCCLSPHSHIISYRKSSIIFTISSHSMHVKNSLKNDLFIQMLQRERERESRVTLVRSFERLALLGRLVGVSLKLFKLFSFCTHVVEWRRIMMKNGEKEKKVASHRHHLFAVHNFMKYESMYRQFQ